LGRLFAIRWPNVYIFRLGHLFALAAIPFALVLYFWRLLPRVGAGYRLTNRRLVVHRGVRGIESRSIGLDGFDSIDLDVLAGQEWFDAGDLVFKQAGSEVFRLAGVSRPKCFRQSCLKARMGYMSVRDVFARQIQERSA
jgi:hypothetical protein